MRPQDPPFPSFSLALSRANAQPSFVVFPWAPIIYQDPNPVAQFPVHANPSPAASQPPAPNNLAIILRAIRHSLATIATKLRMRSAS
ncbi:hypothetical protein FB451DRAFT_1564510 [Mycena latifolia]|nr:hypothetical protein FB451DRAFT_1564510 [Mycena latifolia]